MLLVLATNKYELSETTYSFMSDFQQVIDRFGCVGMKSKSLVHRLRVFSISDIFCALISLQADNGAINNST